MARAPSHGRMQPMVSVHDDTARDELVAELHSVLGAVSEEGHNHVPSDPKLVGVLGAEQAAQAASEAEVGQAAGHRGIHARVAVAGDDGVHDSLERGARGFHGCEVPEHGLKSTRAHGQDLVECAAICGPGEDGAPVSPRLDSRVARAAQRDDHIREGLAHGPNGRGDVQR